MGEGYGRGGGPPRSVRGAVRVYGLLLALYPPGFRSRHRREMERFFTERATDALRQRGTPGLLAYLVRAAWDVAVTASAEWMNTTTTGGGGGMDGLWKDVRYAVRALLRAPGFALVAVVTIGLGIGANTAVFSVVRSVLLRPLPYDDPEELVLVWGEMRTRGVTDFPTSPPDLLDIREKTTAFEEVAAVFTFDQPLTGEGEPQQITVAGVTPNFFRTLGVEPARGRDFVASDADPVAPDVQPGDPGFANQIVLLSHALWEQRFGSDPSAVGRIIDVGGTPAEIVGVLPPDFELTMPPGGWVADDIDLWTAMRIDFAAAPRNNVFLIPLARLADGVSVERAQSELDRLAGELRSEYTVKSGSGFHMRAVRLHDDVTEGARPFLLALMGAVVFVLLVACANIANLLLVRASTRERELAVRAAMGGSAGRIVRQLLAESVTLAAVGALVGVAFGWLGVRLLLALRPAELPRIESITLDGTVLAFTALAALVAAVVFGLAPALQAARVDPGAALKERGGAAGAAGRRLRSVVMVGEVALTVVLLVGAGLMMRSLVALSQVDPGFEADDVLTFGVPVAFARYPTAEERAQLADRLQERIRALPGVNGVTAAAVLPLEAPPLNGRWGLAAALADPEAFQQADYQPVLPGYFETLDTELLAGRTLTRTDNADSLPVVVVDTRLAEKAFPGESAVGRRILVRTQAEEPHWVEIVGVVENQRTSSLVEEGRETIYFPARALGSVSPRWAVEVQGNALALVPAIRRAVEGVDPDLPVHDVRPMAEYVRGAMAETRFALVLIGVFAGIALLLSAVGLFGVLSYAVRQRTAEIGVRMAFGAEGGSIVRLVVGQGLALVGVGVALGLAAAVGVTGLMSSFLVEVRPTDPVTFAGVALFFTVVGALACALPALRATRIDPMEALHAE